jgi:hypothetical protein
MEHGHSQNLDINQGNAFKTGITILPSEQPIESFSQ